MEAPVDRVFAALVDPDLLLEWLPPEGMTGRFEHVDMRPGGSYRLVLTYRPGPAAHARPGRDIQPDKTAKPGEDPGGCFLREG